jgi:hypothetical protein
MRAPLLALLLAPSLAFAGDLGVIPADWNRLEVPLGEEEIVGLREMGFRLDPDGRVLDLELKALDAAGLARARQLLAATQRRRNLERLRAFLATQPQDAPLSPDARRQAMQLADGNLFAAVSRNEMTASALSKLARMDLHAVARVFDGNAAAGAASVAVAAPETAPRNRPRFPYLTAAEQQVGERLQAAAVAQLSNYERGRLIVSRLNGADGRPDLPPFLVEETGTGAAKYDVIRRAVVIDRNAAITELMQGVLPVDRAGRRRELDRPDALAQALAANPDALSRLMAHNDVLVAHELTHAWQDRRDTLWRRMRRGHIPQAVPFEYEEEANLEKNLYIHDVIRGNPGAAIDPQELENYRSMLSDYTTWLRELRETYRADTEGSVADLSRIAALTRARRDAVQNIPAKSPEEQRQKDKLLVRIAAGERAISELQAAHAARIQGLKSGDVARAGGESNPALARHFLAVGSSLPMGPNRTAALNRALVYARASGDAALVEQVQSQMTPAP